MSSTNATEAKATEAGPAAADSQAGKTDAADKAPSSKKTKSKTATKQGAKNRAPKRKTAPRRANPNRPHRGLAHLACAPVSSTGSCSAICGNTPTSCRSARRGWRKGPGGPRVRSATASRGSKKRKKCGGSRTGRGSTTYRKRNRSSERSSYRERRRSEARSRFLVAPAVPASPPQFQPRNRRFPGRRRTSRTQADTHSVYP